MIMETTLKVGDEVRLKSFGSPWMTVIAVGGLGSAFHDPLTCNWFVNCQELREAIFPADSLEKKP